MIAPPPPTVAIAQGAVHLIYDEATLTGEGQIYVGACPRVGHSSRACKVRITGRTPLRLRVVVTTVSTRDDGRYSCAAYLR